MNNGRLKETLYIGRRRSYQIRVYNKLLEQQTNLITRYLQGEIMECGRRLAVKNLPESFVRSVQQVGKMMMLSVVLSIGLR